MDILHIKMNNLKVKIDNGNLLIINKKLLDHEDAILKVIPKDKILAMYPELEKIKYQHLWLPLAKLSIFTELLLEFIYKNITNS